MLVLLCHRGVSRGVVGGLGPGGHVRVFNLKHDGVMWDLAWGNVVGWASAPLVLGATGGLGGFDGLGPGGLDDRPVQVLGGEDLHAPGPDGHDVVPVGLVEPGEQVRCRGS